MTTKQLEIDISQIKTKISEIEEELVIAKNKEYNKDFRKRI